MADTQKPLVSTVDSNASKQVKQLVTDSIASTADSVVLQSEFRDALQSYLTQLASNGSITELNPDKRLEETAPSVASFVAALEESVFKAKASTVQGLLLQQSLQSGLLTQKQFETAVKEISIEAAALIASTAVDVPVAVQSLILSILNDYDLKVQPRLSSAAVLTAASVQALEAPKTEVSAAVLTAASVQALEASAAVLSETPVQKKEVTLQTDGALGNNDSYLEKLLKIIAKQIKNNFLASRDSLFSLRPQPRIMSGARAVVKINGKVTALCTNVTYNISMDWQEIRGIDELLPNDLAPSSFSVTGSMSLYRVPDNSPIKNFIHSDMFRGLVWPYTTIEIRDKRTDELLVLIKRCAITSRSESYAHGQPVITTMNFVGIGFRDEEIPKFLPDKLEGSESSGGLLSAITDLFKF